MVPLRPCRDLGSSPHWSWGHSHSRAERESVLGFQANQMEPWWSSRSCETVTLGPELSSTLNPAEKAASLPSVFPQAFIKHLLPVRCERGLGNLPRVNETKSLPSWTH